MKKQLSFSISKLADEFEISTRTIRYYEEKGLLSPKRTGGNQRIYSRRDKARLKLILRGKRFGYSLEQISEMIGFSDGELEETDQIRRSLEYGDLRLKEIRERIAELKTLEQDILSVMDKLVGRLEALENSKINKKGERR
jgi:DNA-binding transcriptional MerR regulator